MGPPLFAAAADAVLAGHGGGQDIEVVAIRLDDFAEEVVAEAAVGVGLVGERGSGGFRNGFGRLVRRDGIDANFFARLLGRSCGRGVLGRDRQWS